MGVLRVIGLVFLGLFLLALALVIGAGVIFLLTHMHQTQATNQTQAPQPQTPPTQGLIKVTNQAAGIAYIGPNTTALAGYYCVNTAIPSTYSIQLNTKLSNGYWLQDVYSTINEIINGAPTPGFNAEVWTPPSWDCTTENNSGIIVISCHSHLVGNYYLTYYGATCAWLIIKIANGIAYFGYSLDGQSINWYYQYPVGNATIIGSDTTLVVGGYGNWEGVNFTNANIVLALYYWNGTAWLPARAPALVVVLGNGLVMPGFTGVMVGLLSHGPSRSIKRLKSQALASLLEDGRKEGFDFKHPWRAQGPHQGIIIGCGTGYRLPGFNKS
ncbi:hypothetical protein [Vulcanisaeta sp. JCM 16159]|uniref:hypothetical protein n=1 Tax=Vulcanisaeta sp. JCM 16159 TaxID=1295371 RepID=UPI0006D132B8|nr:hypothetical protein [Vulcanisaeta sp. JCM 16159]